MAEYIEREKLNDTLDELCVNDSLYNALQFILAADVAPVVHGHWIEDDEVVCSECGELGFTEYRNGEYCYPDYCPWCGAKMDGERNANT